MPGCKCFFITGNIFQMLEMVFFIFLILPGFRHSVKHPLRRIKIRMPNIIFRRIQDLCRLRSRSIKYAEKSENNHYGHSHNQNFSADL